MKSTGWIVTVIIAAAAAVVGIGTLAGCDPKAEFAGGDKKLSTEEVAVLVERENARAVAQAQAAVKQLEREAAERTRAFQRSLDRLIAEQNFEREDLADLYDRDAAELRGRAEAIAAAAQKSVDERLAAQAAHAAEIEKQWKVRDFIAGALDTGEELASGIPGMGPIIGILGSVGGVAGLFGMRRKGRQVEEIARDKAAAQARADKVREAAGALAEVTSMLPRDIRGIIAAAMKRFPEADQAAIKEIRREDSLHELEQMTDEGKLALTKIAA